MLEFVAYQLVECLRDETQPALASLKLPADWISVSNDSQNAIQVQIRDFTAYYKISVDWKNNRYNLHIVIINPENDLHYDNEINYTTVLQAITDIATDIKSFAEKYHGKENHGLHR